MVVASDSGQPSPPDSPAAPQRWYTVLALPFADQTTGRRHLHTAGRRHVSAEFTRRSRDPYLR